MRFFKPAGYRLLRPCRWAKLQDPVARQHFARKRSEVELWFAEETGTKDAPTAPLGTQGFTTAARLL